MKNHLYLLVFLGIAITTIFSCTVSDVKSTSQPVSHDMWDGILKKHVDEDGWVDYEGVIEDSARLHSYLNILEGAHPNDKNWTRDERMAYWINAYNAFTIKLIIDNYPVESIKDIKGGIAFINSVWDIKFIEIEDEKYDLNNIEHGILRPKYDDARVHFAVNCASVSCPQLANFAFTADNLDEQLDLMGQKFLADDSKNKIESANKATLSPIFSWFSKDFKKEGGLVKFVNRFTDNTLNEDAKIDYMDYDWSLNGISNAKK